MLILDLLRTIFIDDDHVNKKAHHINRRANQSSRYIKVKRGCHEKKYRINKYGEIYEV